ncbi:MAG: transporter [bacterium]|nr:transporter [bacterium]
MKQIRTIPILILIILAAPLTSMAHHGVASLGVAGLEGPGAPIETSSSATLPTGGVLALLKLDQARFDKFTPATDDEGDTNAFWMYGLGYGFRPWLSAYVILPFNAKRVEDNSYNTAGFADMSLLAVFGFKYDQGLRPVPAVESMDDLEDWHFTVYGGCTLPTGEANVGNSDGEIDPGMSLGFGKPSWSLGLTTTKQFGGRLTGVLDASWITFREYVYADGAKVRFGDELRGNAAATWRLAASSEHKFRLDANFELNYLKLGRDESDGEGDEATGGAMLYALPGFRVFYGSTSLALGIKRPIWTDLNEDALQQGAEGKERYRLVLGFSVIM